MELVFNAETEGRLGQIDHLSEGLQSLFYLSLVGMMFDLEEQMIKESIEADSNDSDEEDDDGKRKRRNKTRGTAQRVRTRNTDSSSIG